MRLKLRAVKVSGCHLDLAIGEPAARRPRESPQSGDAS
jgi:hypothetical protein